MKKLFLVLLACLSLQARADIIYEWVGNNDATPFNISLRLVFDDHAFDDGAVDLTIRQEDGQLHADAGLREFNYRAPGFCCSINYAPMTTPLGRYAELRMHLLLDGEALTGSFYANDSNSHIGMLGYQGLFEVTTANSDYGMYAAGCENFIDCHGGTGQFVRMGNVSMPGHAELPEPGSLALLGFGLIGLISRPRRTL